MCCKCNQPITELDIKNAQIKIRKEEKRFIEEMIDKAVGSANDFIQIGRFSRFQRDQVVSIEYVLEDQTHIVTTTLKNRENPSRMAFPFGFLDQLETH